MVLASRDALRHLRQPTPLAPSPAASRPTHPQQLHPHSHEHRQLTALPPAPERARRTRATTALQILGYPHTPLQGRERTRGCILLLRPLLAWRFRDLCCSGRLSQPIQNIVHNVETQWQAARHTTAGWGAALTRRGARRGCQQLRRRSPQRTQRCSKPCQDSQRPPTRCVGTPTCGGDGSGATCSCASWMTDPHAHVVG